jgi:hypothetical protein
VKVLHRSLLVVQSIESLKEVAHEASLRRHHGQSVAQPHRGEQNIPIRAPAARGIGMAVRPVIGVLRCVLKGE